MKRSLKRVILSLCASLTIATGVLFALPFQVRADACCSAVCQGGSQTCCGFSCSAADNSGCTANNSSGTEVDKKSCGDLELD